MTLRKNLFIVPAALCALAAVPAMAQNAVPSSPDTDYEYRHSTITQQQTISSPQPSMDTDAADRNARAMALHDQAVALAHRATATAQRGDRRGAARIAARAQALFNQAFALTHPQLYAHRRGMD